MTRKEHLDWAKARALEYCDQGDVHSALTSMISDLGKHEETQGHPAIPLGMDMLLAGHLDSPRKMREFIEGFN